MSNGNTSSTASKGSSPAGGSSVGVVKVVAAVVGVVVVALLGVVAYMYFGTPYSAPEDVRVTNVTDRSATVSWKTADATPGVVVYSEDESFYPWLLAKMGKEKAYDDRDVSAAELAAAQELADEAADSGEVSDLQVVEDVTVSDKGDYYTHHVTIKGLEPEKTYYFMVGNGVRFEGVSEETSAENFTFSRNGSVTTRAEIEDIRVPSPTYGGIIADEGDVTDAVVFMEVGAETPVPSAPLSSPVNGEGKWYIDIAYLWDKDGNLIETVEEGSLMEAILVDAGPKGDSGRVLIPMDYDAPAREIEVSTGQKKRVEDDSEETSYLIEYGSTGELVSMVNAQGGSCPNPDYDPNLVHTCGADDVCMDGGTCGNCTTSQCQCYSSDNRTKCPSVDAGSECHCTRGTAGAVPNPAYSDQEPVYPQGPGGAPPTGNPTGTQCQSHLSDNWYEAGTYGCGDPEANPGCQWCCGVDPNGRDVWARDLDACPANSTVGSGGGVVPQSGEDVCEGQDDVREYLDGTAGMCCDGAFYPGLSECPDICCARGQTYRDKNSCYLMQQWYPDEYSDGVCTPVSPRLCCSRGQTLSGNSLCDDAKASDPYDYSEGACSQTTESFTSGSSSSCDPSNNQFDAQSDCLENTFCGYMESVGNDNWECKTDGGNCYKCVKTDSDAPPAAAEYVVAFVQILLDPPEEENLEACCVDGETQMLPVGECADVKVNRPSISASEGECSTDGLEQIDVCCHIADNETYKDTDYCSQCYDMGICERGECTEACCIDGETEILPVGRCAEMMINDINVSEGECAGGQGLVPRAKAQDSAEYTVTDDYLIKPSGDGVYDIEIPGIGSKTGLRMVDGKEYVFYVDVNGNGEVDPDIDEAVEVGEYDIDVSVDTSKEIFEVDLDSGYNFVSFEYMPSETDSCEILADMNEQSGVLMTQLARFESGRFEVTSYRDDTDTTSGECFPVVPGRGYVVRSFGDDTVALDGYSLNEAADVSFDTAGWHLIGVNGASTVYTAESLLDAIDEVEGLDADNVTQWEADKSKYEGLQKEEDDSGEMQVYGFDFPINDGQGYFVRVADGAGVWSP